MGISIPPFPDIRPSVVGSPPSSGAADLGQAFLQAFLGAQQQKGANSRSSAELDVRKQELAFEIAKEKTKQAREKALGELRKAVLPALMAQGGAQLLMPPQQGSGVGGQNTPVPQPGGLPPIRQTPSTSWTLPNDGSRPMDRLFKVLRNVPGELAGDFLATNLPDAMKAQEVYDMGIAFDDAEQSVASLLTPQQRDAMRAAKKMMMAGRPQEQWAPFMPKAQLELAAAVEQAKAAKSKKDADAIAFPYLVAYGVAAMDAPPTNAADKLFELRRDLLKQAREAKAAEAKTNIDLLVKGLEGVALDMAVQSNTTKPSDIYKRLRGMAMYDVLPDGILLQVANEAPRKASDLTGAKNEKQISIQAVAGTGLLAYSKIEEMTKKGTTLGLSAYLASTPAFASASAGAIAGAAAGMKAAGMVETATPRGAGGRFVKVGAPQKMFRHPAVQVGAPLLGGVIGAGAGVMVAPIAEMTMSSDQQELYTAGQDFLDMVIRPRTGAVVNAVERLVAMQTYLDFGWDSEPRKALKRALRARQAETIERVANLPVDMQSDRLRERLEQDRRLLGIPEDGEVDPSARSGRIAGPTDNFVFRAKRPDETATDYADAYEAAFARRNAPRRSPAQSVQTVDAFGRPIGRPRRPD